MISDAERLVRYVAGADATPCPIGGVPTPGQLWYRLLSMPPDQRTGRLAHFIANADVAHACFSEDHRGQVQSWRERYERLAAATTDLRR